MSFNFSDFNLNRPFVDERLTIDSTQDSQYVNGNYASLELGFKTINAKAINAFRCAIKSTDSDAQYFPYRNLFADRVGRGHVHWEVSHFALNKGYPTSWTNDAGTTFASGAACPYICLELDRSNVTTNSIYDSSENLVNGGHIITRQNHGYVNKQPASLIPISGFNTENQTSTRGIKSAFGSTVFLQVLSPDTFRMCRDRNLTDPLSISANDSFPTFPSPVTGATYVQNATTLTVTKTAHGLVRGNRVKMNFTSGTGRPANKLYEVMSSTANTFTLEASLGARETTVVSGSCEYIVNPTAFLLYSWDIHSHKSSERTWAGGDVNTYEAISYGEGDRGTKRINGVDVHYAECKIWITSPSGANLDVILGEDQNNGQYLVRRNSSDNLDLLRLANNHNGIQQPILIARLNKGPNGTFELNAPQSITCGTSTKPVQILSSTISGNNVSSQLWQSRNSTTGATTVAIKSLPAILVDTIQTFECRVTVKDSTLSTLRLAHFRISGAMQRTTAGGTTLIGTPVITELQNNIPGFTTSNFTVTVSAGVLNINGVGLAATNLEWRTSNLIIDNF